MEGTGISHPEGSARIASVAALRQVLQDMTWTSLRVQAKFLSEYGLTNFQALVIRALSVQDSPPDMAFLSEMTAIPPSTMTSVVDRLERDGLAERAPHARDRRRLLVSLTEKGQDMLERLDAEAIRFTADLLREVDDESLAVVIGTLNQMNERLKHLDEA
jgi:DNA-binding MarR family transcriptional regulator